MHITDFKVNKMSRQPWKRDNHSELLVNLCGKSAVEVTFNHENYFKG